MDYIGVRCIRGVRRNWVAIAWVLMDLPMQTQRQEGVEESTFTEKESQHKV